MKNSNLHNIKAAGFTTPDGYFESLDERVLSKLGDNNPLENTVTSGFNVPKDYFETFDDRLLDAIHKDKNTDTKVVSLFSWKKVAYVSGIAASVVLVVTLIFNNSGKVTFDDLETASIESYLMNEDVSAYDLANYLNPNEMNSNSFINENINDSSIEEYLLQNTDVEHLITD